MNQAPVLPRYGRPGLSRAARRRITVALGGLVVIVGVIIAVVAYQRLDSSDVTGTLAGYRVIDDETVSVTISVTRSDPSRPVDCIVRARSKDGSETGRREVLIPPSHAATVQITTVVKSNRPPVMGDVYGCGTDVPEYLKSS